MDAYGDAAAASSLSTSEKYDVFLSFRGEDTRDKFISHLFAALERKKIKTFLDEKSLERGDEISPSLLKAIQKSKISIIVFSKCYASSSFCLSELVHILECHRQNRQMVIPIFYEVDPSHIRKQEGSYGEAFLKHEERLKDSMDVVQKWRAALTESSSLSGWDSQVIRPESKLVEAIVEDVLKKLNHDQSSTFSSEGLIGIDKLVEEIKLFLNVRSSKACIVGIWGMGGIGKTTLAEVIFNQLSHNFEASCFVANVREESEKGSLMNLRSKLLSELLKEEIRNVGTPSLGPTFVKERLKRTKVLVVLDDVNHIEQLRSFVGNRDQFSCEIRIIITTRDAKVLRDIPAAGMYEVKPLQSQEALQLFNLIAFRGSSPVADHVELSRNVVKLAGGIPLAIIVLGSYFRSLRYQSKEAWEAALDKLKVVHHDHILNVLEISYDALDNTEKGIFLDITCFFKGMSRDYIEKILDACGFFATNGIDALIDKSIITVKYNVLWMHDLLEEMGQKIVCQESPELGERSRLWVAEDVCQVLENNTGTSKIQGIFLDLSTVDEAIHLKPKVFKKMHNLRLLKIYDSFNNRKCKVYLQHGLFYLPRSLRYLEWHEYPLKSLPPIFKPKNLVELKMPHSKLEELWSGVQDLGMLRSIDLRHSIHLTQIPDLSGAPNLERINLEYCASLLQVPLHILKNLNKLTYVNLGYCNKLQSVLDRIFDAVSLRSLTLKGCSNLNTFPMIISRSLESLDLSSTSIISLPSSIDSLKILSKLSLKNRTRLAILPSNMNKLDSLRYLELGGCSILEKFPELPCNIEELDLSGTAIKEVAPSLNEHQFILTKIDMSACKGVQSLPTNIFKLTRKLDLSYCSNLKNLPEILEPIESLQHLYLEGSGIRQLPMSIGNLIGVQKLYMHNCNSLESVPSSICHMASLRNLNLSNCPKLEYYPVLTGRFLPWDLYLLNLSNSNMIEIPASIKGLCLLTRLYINNCKNLLSLPELPLSLEILDASGCTSLEVVSNSKRALTREFWNDYRITEETVEYSIFNDCLKLDQNEQDNIIFDFNVRVLRMATQFIPPEDQIWNPAVHACCPGNEIPKWFKYQREGSCINIKLPLEWHNANFLGFVVCGVGDSYSDIQGLHLICQFNLKPYRGQYHKFTWRFTDYNSGYGELPTTSNSGTVYMWYHHRDYRKCLDAEEASCDFSFRVWDESENDWTESSKCEVKKCGVAILYHKDLEEFKLNFMNEHVVLEESDSDMDLEESYSAAILDKPEPSACRTTDYDTEELHPKRIKF